MPTATPTPTPTPIVNVDITLSPAAGNISNRSAQYKLPDNELRDEKVAVLNKGKIVLPKGELYSVGVEQDGAYPQTIVLSAQEQENLITMIETAYAQVMENDGFPGIARSYPVFHMVCVQPTGKANIVKFWLNKENGTVTSYWNNNEIDKRYYSFESSELYEFMSKYLVVAEVP